MSVPTYSILLHGLSHQAWPYYPGYRLPVACEQQKLLVLFISYPLEESYEDSLKHERGSGR